MIQSYLGAVQVQYKKNFATQIMWERLDSGLEWTQKHFCFGLFGEFLPSTKFTRNSLSSTVRIVQRMKEAK